MMLVLLHRKKKKDKNKDKKFLEQVNNAVEQEISEKSSEVKRTKAELAFLKQQEKLVSILAQFLFWVSIRLLYKWSLKIQILL